MTKIRLAVLADIHGNLPALEAILGELSQKHIDGYVVAGDLTSGPRDNEVLYTLIRINARVIPGNTDLRILAYIDEKIPPSWRTLQQFAMTRWAAGHLSTASIAYLRSLPEQLVISIPGTAPFRVVHGSPRDPNEGLFPGQTPDILGDILAQLTEAVLVCGHVHKPWCLEQNGRLGFNPGAVSGSLNGIIDAHYGLMTWNELHWQVDLRKVEYNHEHYRRDFVDSGFLHGGGGLARAFLLSDQTGTDVAQDFFHYAISKVGRDQLVDGIYLPDEAWHKAEETFDWDLYEKPKAR